MIRRIVFLSTMFMALSISAFAFSIKFDVAVRGNLGVMTTFGSTTNDINALFYSGRIYLDNIFVLENTPIYGASVGLIVGYGVVNQSLKTAVNIPESEATTEGGTGYAIQPAMPNVTAKQMNVGLIGRFFPVNNISIGVGFVLNIITSDGSYMTNENITTLGGTAIDATQFESAFIQPMFAGMVPEVLIEVTATRFIGNFGIDFGVNANFYLKPIMIGGGATFGVRYRFDPY